MNITAVRRACIPCLGLIAMVFFIVLVLPAVQVGASPSGVLEACINPGNGMMRLVDASTACHVNETFVTWNITGPQGPQGPQGATGCQGPQGPQGAAGSSAGGPPAVGVCTPAIFPQTAGHARADVYIFSRSSSTANAAPTI